MQQDRSGGVLMDIVKGAGLSTVLRSAMVQYLLRKIRESVYVQ